MLERGRSRTTGNVFTPILCLVRTHAETSTLRVTFSIVVSFLESLSSPRWGYLHEVYAIYTVSSVSRWCFRPSLPLALEFSLNTLGYVGKISVAKVSSCCVSSGELILLCKMEIVYRIGSTDVSWSSSLFCWYSRVHGKLEGTQKYRSTYNVYNYTKYRNYNSFYNVLTIILCHLFVSF